MEFVHLSSTVGIKTISEDAKKGIFEGDLDEGELEIGQVAAAIKEVKPASEILQNIWTEYLHLKNELCAKG